MALRQPSGLLPGVAFIVESFAYGIRNANPKLSHLAATSITSLSISNRLSESINSKNAVVVVRLNAEDILGVPTGLKITTLGPT